jgi:CHASE3 domain sensor protein
MRLRRRLGLVAAVYVVLMATTGTAALFAARSRAASATKGRSLTVALERVGQMRAAFLDMETGVRGFQITGDATFLEEFEVGSRSAATWKAEIAELTGNDATFAQDLSAAAAVGSR